MLGEKCLHDSTRDAVSMSRTREPSFNTGNHEFPIATMRPGIAALTIAVLAVSMCAQTASSDQSADLKPTKSTPVNISGYVRDMACLMKFSEALRPTNDCALMCARAGSPLVIVTKKGVIYVPMSAEIPDTSQREKLMPFVGSYVEIAGEMFQRSGLRTIVIAQIKKADDTGVTSKK
jgi:hypothetical protein